MVVRKVDGRQIKHYKNENRYYVCDDDGLVIEIDGFDRLAEAVKWIKEHPMKEKYNKIKM